MGRGVSSGGGQSSLSYLFGSGEAPRPVSNNAPAPPIEGHAANNGPSSRPTAAAQPIDVTKQVPAGIHGNTTNNYFRADGQNTGNFITRLHLEAVAEFLQIGKGPFKEYEVVTCLLELEGDKALGPGAFSMAFWKFYSPEVRNNVMEFFKEFHLSLDWVLKHQSTFVRDNKILDAASIANETIDLRNKSFMVDLECKMDMEKVYDYNSEIIPIGEMAELKILASLFGFEQSFKGNRPLGRNSVDSKTFEISVEVAGKKQRGIIVERSRGFTSWIRFGESSLGWLLEGVETSCRGEGGQMFVKRWEDGGRKFRLECRTNDAGRFLLCSMVDSEAKRHCLVFPEGKGFLGGWALLAEKLRSIGILSEMRIGKQRYP
ncbi:Protein SPIRAL1-like 1 [Vitis vinifera]|uniref:Protein SPIRAL1-like 1 n=1 Tax=Vitis vinifera TaxID=29760 RepID=A0A438E6W2_VITVI|nr:Protein SPIRAL1-like 1 [Vitis vinifera]